MASPGAEEVELCRAAMLWLALREHVPDRGEKIEDVLADKSLKVMFDATERELSGEGFDEDKGQFRITVTADSYDCPLDPLKAVAIKTADLWAKAGLSPSSDKVGDLTHVPRFPVDQAEARAMMLMTTIVADPAAIGPSTTAMTYAGYTDDELRRGRPVVVVR